MQLVCYDAYILQKFYNYHCLAIKARKFLNGQPGLFSKVQGSQKPTTICKDNNTNNKQVDGKY